jgi:hypothetical protein
LSATATIDIDWPIAEKSQRAAIELEEVMDVARTYWNAGNNE